MTVLDGPDELRAALGTQFGPGEWLAITDNHIAGFADATGTDDPAYLPVSLSNLLVPSLVKVTGFAMGVNYGTGAIRFGPPVTAGHRLRATVEIMAVDEITGGLQTTMLITVEIAGEDEPACTIESLSRWIT
jgi:acyl dehydratase